ncbi:plasma-membrane proton-efflux P-type ATPase [bacterium]|nr:plasma-membrane proton-efflux P-type ATPase [bacterium]
MEEQKLPLDELKKKLNASDSGLSSEEAKERSKKYGRNEIEEKKENFFLKLLSYFWGPIPWMLEVAVVLSLIVGHYADFGILLVLLVSNCLVGFWEEWNAGNEIAALRARLPLQVRVQRDGKWIALSAAELVPGDVVRLRPGDIVPADCRLLDKDPLEVDQSVLTGESLPTSSKEGDAIYSGSIIKQGEGNALVYGTGPNTYFGKTAELVQDAKTTSHFQKAVLKIGNYLILLTAALVVTIIVVAIFRGDPILDTIEFAMVLTIAGIPVAMPTVLSVTMAIGARLLAKKEVVVTKLVSIEELASMNILCSDKTGTLTKNTLTLGESFSLGDFSSKDLLLYAALSSREEDNDTIDSAVLDALSDKKEMESFTRMEFHPFDPVSKRTEAKVEKEGEEIFVSKGAPQVILELCEGEYADKVEEAVNNFAAKGYRALGVAKKSKEKWEFLGLLSLFDPPREDAKETIETAKEMGISVKMITGDQTSIAKETAQTLGMGTNIVNVSKLGAGEKDLEEAVVDADGFSQVFPEHKFRIIEAFQQKGDIVGMTGDGVNDAPALKKADCGVAVSGATDTARAAASIVLLNKGLHVIIDAIKESRKIFQRMNSYAMFRISETLCVVFFMTLSILAYNFYPLTAVMIVMLALLNDGAILSIAYDRVQYKKDPEEWNMPLVIGFSTILGLIQVCVAFSLFYLSDRVFLLDRDATQTLMYLYFSLSGHLTIFITRTRGPFWSILPAKILFFAVCGTQALATCIAVYGLLMTPIGWEWALFIWAYCLGFFLIKDLLKLLVYKVLDPERK